MPIYEYRCSECQQLFEEWCKHVEDGDVAHSCPICKAPAERIISNTSFALKGGGWYVTEYGGKQRGKDVAPSSGGVSSAAASDGAACVASSGSPAPAASAPAASTPVASGGAAS